MKEWCRFPILFTLELVEMNATINNITSILLKCMAKYGGVRLKSLFDGGYALVLMEIMCSRDIKLR